MKKYKGTVTIIIATDIASKLLLKLKLIISNNNSTKATIQHNVQLKHAKL